MPTASGTTPQWIVDLFKKLGVAPTPTNVQAFELWSKSEVPNALEYNNPLNTSLDASHYQLQPGTQIPIYPSEQIGVAETAKTLQESGYSNVVAVLKQGGDLTHIYEAINSSKWDAGGQGGFYPIALAEGAGIAGNPNYKYSGPITGPGSGSSAGGVNEVGGNINTTSQVLGAINPFNKGFASGAIRDFFGGFFSFVGLSGPQELGIRFLEIVAGAILFGLGLLALIAAAAGKTGGDLYSTAKTGAALAAV